MTETKFSGSEMVDMPVLIPCLYLFPDVPKIFLWGVLVGLCCGLSYNTQFNQDIITFISQKESDSWLTCLSSV